MTNRFAPGTFTPDPRPATVQKMLTAQFGLELKLLLRNGEQLLLTMFIPITLLVGSHVAAASARSATTERRRSFPRSWRWR